MFYSRDFRHINYKPTMELLDQIKRSLDYFYRKNKNSGDNQMASVYQSLKKDLVEIADKVLLFIKQLEVVQKNMKVLKKR